MCLVNWNLLSSSWVRWSRVLSIKKKKSIVLPFTHSVKLGAGDAKVVAQLVEPLPSIHKGLCSVIVPHKPGMAAQNWNLSTLQVEAAEPGV